MRLLPLLLLFPSLTFAADFTAVQYECSQMQPAKDGMRCAVVDIDGMGATLLMRMHAKENSPPAIRARVKYLLRRAMDQFMAVGGTFMVQRATLPSGKVNERICSRTKRKWTEQCEEWEPADKDNNAIFKAIDPQ